MSVSIGSYWVGIQILKATGFVLESDVESWFGAYLHDADNSAWSADMAMSVKEALLAAGTVLDSDGWKPLRDENAPCFGMQAIAQAVISAATSIMAQHGEPAPAQAQILPFLSRKELDATTALPNARYILIEPEPCSMRSAHPEDWERQGNVPDTVYDCVGFAEFKRRDDAKSIYENERQVLGGAARLTYDDPCRFQVYALTVENASTRLWNFNSAHIGVSKRFNCHEMPEHLIRYFLYLAFASKAQLGFDSTVTRTRDSSGRLAYRYSIGGRYFRTVGAPLVEHNAFYIISARVRVWIVQEVDESGTEIDASKYVLKDSFLYDDAIGERATQRAILDKLPATQQQEAAPYFLTFLFDEVVPNGKTPRWPRSRRVDFSPDPEQYIDTQRGPWDPISDPHIRAPVLRSRIHRRTLVEEVCQTFYEITNFHDMNLGIAGLIKGLGFLREANFVHCDISGGNVLWYNGQIKITDLEYAKMYGTAMSDNNIGTPWFMAVEIQMEMHLFLPPDVDADADAFSSEPEDSPYTEGVYHNYLHDLEGALWLMDWYILNFVPKSLNSHPLDPVLRKEVHAMLELNRKLFDTNRFRSSLLTGIWTFQSPHRHNKIYPLTRSIFLRQRLVEAYKDVYGKPVANTEGVRRWDDSAFPGMEFYDQLAKAFRDVVARLPPGQLDSNAMSIAELDLNEERKDYS